MSITDELLAELEAAAGNACCYARDDWFSADDFDHPFEQGDAELIAIANPSTIKALLAHIVELKRDAERYRYIRSDGIPDQAIAISDSYYGELELVSPDRLDDAIDAAMESAQ
jgi:hypothetical protein